MFLKLLKLYQDIGAKYTPKQKVLKAEVADTINEAYGRDIHPTNFSKQLNLCEAAGILEIVDRKHISFTGKEPMRIPGLNSKPVKENEFKVSLDDNSLSIKMDGGSLVVSFKNKANLTKLFKIAKDVTSVLDHKDHENNPTPI